MKQTQMFFSPETSAEILQKLLNGNRISRSAQLKTIPRLCFASGQSMSVQASDFHACLPRRLHGPYTHVEVGLPSIAMPELMPFIQHEDRIPPEKSIYPYVPIEVVMDIIVEQGGLSL